MSKGVRRITAVTGREAVATVQRMGRFVEEAVSRFNCRLDELPGRIDALQEEVKKLQTQLKKGTASDLVSAADKLLAGATAIGAAKVIVGELPAAPVEAIRTQVDRLRTKAGSCAIVLAWVNEGRVQLLVSVTNDLVEKGLKAGEVIKEVARVVDGKGGGKPDRAEAGGTNPAKLPEALELARKLIADKLG